MSVFARIQAPGHEQVLFCQDVRTNLRAIIAVHDTNGIRMPERMKAGKFAINGISLAPVEKTIENGRKIVAFRTEKTVAAIKKAMADARTGAQ